MWPKKVMRMSIPERANGWVGLVVGLGGCCMWSGWGAIHFFRGGRGRGFLFLFGVWGFWKWYKIWCGGEFPGNFSQLQTKKIWFPFRKKDG